VGWLRLLIGLFLATPPFPGWKYLVVAAGRQFGIGQPAEPDYERRPRRPDFGLLTVVPLIAPWDPQASLAEISQAWKDVGYRNMRRSINLLAGMKSSSSLPKNTARTVALESLAL